MLKNDTDPDGDPLTVDTIRTGRENKTGTSEPSVQPYLERNGSLTMNADGSYSYTADNAKALNPGETATEYFTYS